MKKEANQGAIINYCADVSVMLRLVRISMEKLEEWLKQDQKGRAAVEDDFNAFWGDRESFLSSLVKLAQLQMKLIPLELELLENEKDKIDDVRQPAKLTDEEWDMLARAISRRKVVEKSLKNDPL